jgi:hypothetical protein
MWTVETMNFTSSGARYAATAEQVQKAYEFSSREDALAFMKSVNAFAVRLIDPKGNVADNRVLNLPIEQVDPLPDWN